MPGLYFVLKSKPNIRAINVKMDSLYFSITGIFGVTKMIANGTFSPGLT